MGMDGWDAVMPDDLLLSLPRYPSVSIFHFTDLNANKIHYRQSRNIGMEWSRREMGRRVRKFCMYFKLMNETNRSFFPLPAVELLIMYYARNDQKHSRVMFDVYIFCDIYIGNEGRGDRRN
jgi:hypothetical protein